MVQGVGVSNKSKHMHMCNVDTLVRIVVRCRRVNMLTTSVGCLHFERPHIMVRCSHNSGCMSAVPIGWKRVLVPDKGLRVQFE